MKTLKEFREFHRRVMFNHNPFRVAQIHSALPQGSALGARNPGLELIKRLRRFMFACVVSCSVYFLRRCTAIRSLLA
jgi:hypothetical protein